MSAVVRHRETTHSIHRTRGTKCSALPSTCGFATFFPPLNGSLTLQQWIHTVDDLGGRLRDIHTFLTEERLPEGWESRVRDQMGLTFLAFNHTVLRVELGIKEEVDQPLYLM